MRLGGGAPGEFRNGALSYESTAAFAMIVGLRGRRQARQ
jgi:hypothetical protein